MTASPARLAANRLNALLATGPRSEAGLARSSANSLKGGLYARSLVVAALGETADDLEGFRVGVVEDLAPVGAVEAELADRAAVLMWRLRRVARCEAASLSAPTDLLPPHPDEVAPLPAQASCLPDPPDATTAHRLARVRVSLASSPAYLAEYREAAAALGPGGDPRAPVSWPPARRALEAAMDLLGWVWIPDQWPPVLAAAGFRRTKTGFLGAARDAVRWTGSRLRRALRAAAEGAGRDPGEFLKASSDRLGGRIAELERGFEERRREEAALAARLVAEREAATAARLYADDGLVARVARAESHLSRELARALGLLAALRAGREPDVPAGLARVGFVLQNGSGPRQSGTPCLGGASDFLTGSPRADDSSPTT